MWVMVIGDGCGRYFRLMGDGCFECEKGCSSLIIGGTLYLLRSFFHLLFWGAVFFGGEVTLSFRVLCIRYAISWV